MKKHIRRIGALFIMVLVLFTGIVPQTVTTAEAKNTSPKITISAKKMTLVKGQSEELYVTGATAKVKWSTSNKKIVTVKNGKVKAKKAGKAYVKAKVGKKTLKCQIQVTKVGINKKSVSLSVGGKETLKILNNKQKVKWTSSKKKVATVDKKGRVKGKKAGTTVITAKVGKKTYKCKVTVKKTKTKSKDENGSYDFTYKPDVMQAELKNEKNYSVSTTSNDELVVNIKKDKNTKNIESGDIIVLPATKKNESVAMKVLTVASNGAKYTLVGKAPDYTEVFNDIDIDASTTGKISDFEANKSVVTSVTTKKGASLDSISSAKTEKAAENSVSVGADSIVISLNDGMGTVEIGAPTIESDIDVDISATGKVDAKKLRLVAHNKITTTIDIKKEYSTELYLGHVTIPIKAGFNADVIFTLVISADGHIYVQNEINVISGIDYTNGTLNSVNNTTSEFEDVYAEVNGSAMVDTGVQLRWLGHWSDKEENVVGSVDIIKADVNVGPCCYAKVKLYNTKPKTCINIDIWLGLNIGIDTDYGIGGFIEQLKLKTSWTLLDNNSKNPLRESIHIEDGKRVSQCTRGAVLDSGSCGPNATYTLSKDGVLTISGTGEVTKYFGEVQYADGRIERYEHRLQIKQVNIEKGIVSIGWDAFSGCSSLTTITIPNSVTSIGHSAFSGCSSLTKITIPNGVTSIGEWAFSDCSSLTTITIPNGVTSIEHGAFMNCSSLTAITIPDSVTSIEYSAFSGCSSLTTIEIPNGVTSIGEFAFDGCKNLTTINIPNGVTSIEDGVFERCSSLTTITIPNSVTSIGDSAFYSCSGLTTITIPNSVTSIGDDAFNLCSSLTTITIPNSVTSIGDAVFRGCGSLTTITIPDSVTSIGEFAFANCSSLTTIEIPNSVTSIGDYAFYSCSGLTTITIPNSVTSLGYMAFRDCSSLTTITIPNSVTSIGYSAFFNCTGLKSLNCCAASKPDGWNEHWAGNVDSSIIHWGYQP